MKEIVIFEDMLDRKSSEEVFVGYIKGTDYIRGGDKRLSRTHRQPNRIYSVNGIHPALSASETQGRYYVCIKNEEKLCNKRSE